MFSVSIIFAQQRHTIYIGRQRSILQNQFTTLGYAYSIAKDYQIEFSANFSKGKHEAPPFTEKISTYTTTSTKVGDIVHNTYPNIQFYTFGYRTQSPLSKHFRIYITPEISWTHVGQYITYLKESKATGKTFREGGFLFGFHTTHEYKATTYSYQAKPSNNAFINCKFGIDAKFNHFIIDLHIAVGARIAGTTQTRFDGKDSSGFHLPNYNFLAGANVGYEF